MATATEMNNSIQAITVFNKAALRGGSSSRLLTVGLHLNMLSAHWKVPMDPYPPGHGQQ